MFLNFFVNKPTGSPSTARQARRSFELASSTDHCAASKTNVASNSVIRKNVITGSVSSNIFFIDINKAVQSPSWCLVLQLHCCL